METKCSDAGAATTEVLHENISGDCHSSPVHDAWHSGSTLSSCESNLMLKLWETIWFPWQDEVLSSET